MLHIPTKVVNQVVDEQFLSEGEAVLVDAVVSAARKITHEAPETSFIQVPG